MSTELRPSSLAFLIRSRASAHSLCSSFSAAGTISLLANSSAVLAICRCSSVKSSGVKMSLGLRSSNRKLPPVILTLGTATVAINDSLLTSNIAKILHPFCSPARWLARGTFRAHTEGCPASQPAGLEEGIVTASERRKDTAPPQPCSSEKKLLHWPPVPAAPHTSLQVEQPWRGRYGCSRAPVTHPVRVRRTPRNASAPLCCWPTHRSWRSPRIPMLERDCSARDAAPSGSRRRLWLTGTPAAVEIKPGRSSRLLCAARRAGPSLSRRTRRSRRSIIWSR